MKVRLFVLFGGLKHPLGKFSNVGDLPSSGKQLAQPLSFWGISFYLMVKISFYTNPIRATILESTGSLSEQRPASVMVLNLLSANS